jgi:hypothetical protein
MKTFLLVIALLAHGKLTQINHTFQVEPDVDKCPTAAIEKKLAADKRKHKITDYDIVCVELPGWTM